MSVSAWDTAIDVERIAAAVGAVPRVTYESAHVYPLSAPHFTPALGAQRNLPLGGAQRLYVHVPFCRYACTFCFYAKRVNSSRALMQRYVDGLRRELNTFESAAPLRQLYVGGGTPTVLPADLLDDLLAAVTAHASLDPAVLHTVEASPESLTAEHIEALRRRGISRVSLGVQTLDEPVLRAVNRQHTATQARDACAMLVAAGLIVNVDLIYGFADQSEDSVQRDIEAFAALGTHSFTAYGLRLNEQTPLARAMVHVDQLDLPRLIRWRRLVEEAMDRQGYEQFRWHMFRRRDRSDVRHDRAPGNNAFGPGREMGIGVSAYSHIGDSIYRNRASVEEYLRCVEAGESPVEEEFGFTPEDRRTLYIARTLGDGRELDLEDYERTFGNSFEADFDAVTRRLQAAGLVDVDGRAVTMTDVGRWVYDLVTLAFYPELSQRWLAQRQ